VEAAGATVTVAGWGATSLFPTRYPTQLYEGSVTVQPNTACATAYPELFKPDTMLCAGVEGGGRDSCSGDRWARARAAPLRPSPPAARLVVLYPPP
jgi:trypsin